MSTSGQFTVSLKDTWATTQGAYSYSLSASAEGGASASASGVMTVAPPEYDCRTATLQALEDNYYRDIPLPGQPRVETVFTAATAFISAPIVGCTQTYRLEMANGSPLPSYYDAVTFAATGTLSFTNDAADLPISDALRIVISSTDNVVNRQDTSIVYPFEQSTSTFTVATRCGVGSTIV